MPLTAETGSTTVERAQEAYRILEEMGLWAKAHEMNPFASSFVAKMHQAVCTYRDKTMVTPKQLFFLRDLKDQYL